MRRAGPDVPCSAHAPQPEARHVELHTRTLAPGHSGARSDRPGKWIRLGRSDRGAVTLQPIVSTSSAISGSYRLRVTKRGRGGSSHIDQSGDFSASPRESKVLGLVTLAGGGAYDARLTVHAGWRTVECSERVGGWL
jgi:hypothetical protein